MSSRCLHILYNASISNQARYEDEKQTIKDILRKKDFDVTIDTTYDQFADVLSEDARSEKLDAGIKLFSKV